VKALQREKPQSFRFIHVPSPGSPGPGDALVRIHRVGVCGTDFSGFLGKMQRSGFPGIPGHELGVVVLELGEGVTHLKVGDRCSVEPYIQLPEVLLLPARIHQLLREPPHPRGE
jgi:alcohol dehydrogenase